MQWSYIFSSFFLLFLLFSSFYYFNPKISGIHSDKDHSPHWPFIVCCSISDSCFFSCMHLLTNISVEREKCGLVMATAMRKFYIAYLSARRLNVSFFLYLSLSCSLKHSKPLPYWFKHFLWSELHSILAAYKYWIEKINVTTMDSFPTYGFSHMTTFYKASNVFPKIKQ